MTELFILSFFSLLYTFQLGSQTPLNLCSSLAAGNSARIWNNRCIVLRFLYIAREDKSFWTAWKLPFSEFNLHFLRECNFDDLLPLSPYLDTLWFISCDVMQPGDKTWASLRSLFVLLGKLLNPLKPYGKYMSHLLRQSVNLFCVYTFRMILTVNSD
jgi:hypothetical protein